MIGGKIPPSKQLAVSILTSTSGISWNDELSSLLNPTHENINVSYLYKTQVRSVCCASYVMKTQVKLLAKKHRILW